ncbi:DUF4942 domain-containing protein [Acidovorax delafieldii]|uniref:DUF4942 domain-containing protein n=1 Tax=Acidovorax delafieldii TaxID=47920 RepID=UPI003ED00417
MPSKTGIAMNYQFYPTGERTAALMWAKFKRPVRHLCEPSAGKGHLIEYAQKGFPNLADEDIPWVDELEDREIKEGRFTARFRDYARRKFSDLNAISVVEIDASHHPALKALGAKVIGYDFQDVSSLATISSVIMNPPFMHGCAHVLHAWDCLYDAELVAIINAESIRNPYSQERQRLVRLIEQHGTVEFLKDQFVDDVERKTDVEVALIYLEKVPGQYIDVNALMGDLRRGDNHYSEIDAEACSALALPGNFIQDTCFRFEQSVSAARKVCEALAIADHLRDSLGVTLEEMQAKGVGNNYREDTGPIREAANAAFKIRYDDLKKRAWAQVLRSTLLTDMLSNQARRKVEATSEDIYDLAFTPANVHGFLHGVALSLGDIYQDMIVMLFDSIIERSSDNVVFYKSWASNRKHRIGMRLRKSRFILPRFRMGSAGSLDYEDQRFLADIDKAFHYLHGGTGDFDGLVEACKKNDIRTGDRYKSRYFEFRYYKGVQTMHFYPKSAEVMDKLNRFVGKIRNWLPGDMQEANADFAKQYDKGEAFTDEYMESYRKASRFSSGTAPHYTLLRELQSRPLDSEEAERTLSRLQSAIDGVHETHGLQCGPALGHSAATPAITMSPTASDATGSPQMDLLAA